MLTFARAIAAAAIWAADLPPVHVASNRFGGAPWAARRGKRRWKRARRCR